MRVNNDYNFLHRKIKKKKVFFSWRTIRKVSQIFVFLMSSIVYSWVVKVVMVVEMVMVMVVVMEMEMWCWWWWKENRILFLTLFVAGDAIATSDGDWCCYCCCCCWCWRCGKWWCLGMVIIWPHLAVIRERKDKSIKILFSFVGFSSSTDEMSRKSFFIK